MMRHHFATLFFKKIKIIPDSEFLFTDAYGGVSIRDFNRSGVNATRELMTNSTFVSIYFDFPNK